ncbi:MAG: nuclear transport factor 2 family protein [Lentisphaeria bacterium]|nr:nuclear transport factor 2 family protein [Lentisphaeria bacterium]
MNAKDKFIQFYEDYQVNNLKMLDELYTETVHFIDPVKEIHGLPNLKKYFINISGNLTTCKFSFEQIDELNNCAYFHWTMNFSNKRLAKGRIKTVKGISYVRIQDSKISYQRDYYDLGEMIYENIQCLNWAIQKIKKNL